MGQIRFRRFKQFSRYNTKRFWKEEIERSKQTFPDQPLPAVIQNLGIKLEDPNNPDFPRKRSLDPIEISHPAWPKPAASVSHPWYTPTPGYVYSGLEPLGDGVNHALSISKAVIRQGLPESILKAADWLNLAQTKEKVEQCIMNSQRWDATSEELPQRRDPIIWWHIFERYYGIPQDRKNDLLLDNLHRFVQLESARQSVNKFRSCRYVRSAPINAVFERHGKTICLGIAPHTTIAYPAQIPPAAESISVEETANEPLVDIKPLTPTVDLQLTNVLNPALLSPFSWSKSNHIVHTVFINKVNDIFYPWSAYVLSGHAIMAAFAAALASAKSIFPDAKGRLPAPVTAQCVQCSGGNLDLIVFQLNTVDFADDSGIKNIVYLDSDNKLFATYEHWKSYESVSEYNENVLRKYVALMSNGVSNGKP